MATTGGGGGDSLDSGHQGMKQPLHSIKIVCMPVDPDDFNDRLKTESRAIQQRTWSEEDLKLVSIHGYLCVYKRRYEFNDQGYSECPNFTEPDGQRVSLDVGRTVVTRDEFEDWITKKLKEGLWRDTAYQPVTNNGLHFLQQTCTFLQVDTPPELAEVVKKLTEIGNEELDTQKIVQLVESALLSEEMDLEDEKKNLLNEKRSPIQASLDPILQCYKGRRGCKRKHCVKCIPLEIRVFNRVKRIPIISILYGYPRFVVYKFVKKEEEEAWRSLIRAVAGTLELGAFISLNAIVIGAGLFSGPLWVAVGTSIMVLTLSSSIGSVVGGGGEMYLDFKKFKKMAGKAQFWTEQRIYHAIIKDTAVFGGVYSTFRAVTKAAQGKKEEAVENAVNAAINLGASSLAVGLNVYFAQQCTAAASTCNLPEIEGGIGGNTVGVTTTTIKSLGSGGGKSAASTALSVLRQGDKLVTTATTNGGATTTGVMVPPIPSQNPVGPPNLMTPGVVLPAAGSSQSVNGVSSLLNFSLDTIALLFAIEWNYGPIRCSKFYEALYEPPKVGLHKGPPLNYMIRTILKSIFGIVANEGDQCLDIGEFEMDLATDAILTASPPVVQATLYWLPVGSNVCRLLLNKNASRFKTISKKEDRLLTEYLVKSLSGSAAVDFPQILENKREYFKYKIFSSTPTVSHPTHYKGTGKRVLAVDGGGIRGLVAFLLLQVIMRPYYDFGDMSPQTNTAAAIAATANCGNIRQYFDYLIGTSTGGLIVLALALGHSIQEVGTLYFKLKDQVFKGSKPYNAKRYEAILKKFFGPQVKMRDIKGGLRVMITAAYHDGVNFQLKLFTNFHPDTMEELVWKVARRTTAAPGYFEPMKEEDTSIIYIDGGLKANNPTRVALKILKENGKLEKGIVVSIGTGVECTGSNGNGGSGRFPNVQGGFWGNLNMVINGDAKKLIYAFGNEITRADGDVVDGDRSMCDLGQCSYFRFTPTLPQLIALDETDDSKLINLLFHTKVYANRHHDLLTEVGRKLRLGATPQFIETVESSPGQPNQLLPLALGARPRRCHPVGDLEEDDWCVITSFPYPVTGVVSEGSMSNENDGMTETTLRHNDRCHDNIRRRR